MEKLITRYSRGLLYSFILLLMSLLMVQDLRLGIAGEASFLDSLKKIDKPFDSRSVAQVRPIIQTTVLSRQDYQGGSFRVLARKQHIERYKCSSCHTAKEVGRTSGFELTHGNVVVTHGQEGSGLDCIDCHHPEDFDVLEDKKGRKIDFDHSYQLCGQCHFRQKRDWLGGAHGKRVSNWAGDRVVFNCTTCHDPHAPKFAKRFPATYAVPLD